MNVSYDTVLSEDAPRDDTCRLKADPPQRPQPRTRVSYDSVLAGASAASSSMQTKKRDDGTGPLSRTTFIRVSKRSDRSWQEDWMTQWWPTYQPRDLTRHHEWLFVAKGEVVALQEVSAPQVVNGYFEYVVTCIAGAWLPTNPLAIRSKQSTSPSPSAMHSPVDTTGARTRCKGIP
jgi:hypothetical protein